MALEMATEPHPEVPEFVVVGVDGHRHPAFNATPRSGVIFQSASIIGPHVQSVETDNSDNNRNELYAPCFKAADELIATANKYSKKRSLKSLSIADVHTWDEVDTAMLAACDSLERIATKDKDTSGFTGKVKSAFRALCQRANIGLNFTNLVPQDFPGGSVLCGGLKMVFTALQSTSNYQDDVYRAIEDLPFTINDHAAYICLDKQDEDLHRRNAALYAALFQLLECILSWFAKNPVGALATAIAFAFCGYGNGNPQGLAEALKMKQANVQRAASRFEKHALWLQNQRHNDSIELQHWMAYELFRTREDVSVIRARCEVLESLTQFLQQAHRSRLETLTGFLDPESTKIRKSARKRSAAELRENFLRDAEYEPAVIEQDINHILRLRMGSRQQLDEDRVVELHNHPQFQSWLSVDESSVLFIQGNSDTPQCKEVAFVAAQVADMAKRMYMEPTEPAVHVIPLAFFCSEHIASRRDRLGHPNALIWMLLLQLVDCYQGFSGSKLGKGLTMTADGESEEVCAAFENLIGHLSSNVIVILVVEGLDSFLHPSIRRELMEIAGFLERLPTESRGNCKLKILCTSTASSDLLEDIFHDDQILRLPRTPRANSGLRNAEALAGLSDIVTSPRF
ncbi:hypothetical protein PG993_010083 [Apiospora rasikravindrae]|uniref:Nephrocystin 3-like N-terminal domain-containing protein n=1 Tax=Apiospora rasikravindrae TaxID=990691 RepID=A0ABR1SNJ8_9PEZI